MPGGIVVRNESQMTRAMQQLATNSELCTQLGSEGFSAWLNHYSYEAVIDSWCKMLEDLDN